MNQLRDDVEALIVSWDAYEKGRGNAPIIDFDCRPHRTDVVPAASRISVLRQLDVLRSQALRSGDSYVLERLNADRSYLQALLGHRAPLGEYLTQTQGSSNRIWGGGKIDDLGEKVRELLLAQGVRWGPRSLDELSEAEGVIPAADAAAAIQDESDRLSEAVRLFTGVRTPYELSIESVSEDAYWDYWLDGEGHRVRLRLNKHRLALTKVKARQFALHEILGHGLQYASLAEEAARSDVPWVRLLSVHTPYQTVFEGLGESLPLFVRPKDDGLKLRVYMDYYVQMVRARLHHGVNEGEDVYDLFESAKQQVPFWTDEVIGDQLTDRSVNPLLRSYLWSYPAGLDWFVRLNESGSELGQQVIRTAYREPIDARRLETLWPSEQGS